MGSAANVAHREPWNKGKVVGQKVPLELGDIRALRVRFQMENRVRELALFNLGIDSKRFCRNSVMRPSMAARQTAIRKPASRTGSLQTKLGL
jgi:hypothetical protein